MARFLRIVLILIASLSLAVCLSCIATRIERRDWIITTAEITFVGLPDGIVFGTFEDLNGTLHTDQVLYGDAWFQIVNEEPKSYYGTTVRIMYSSEDTDLRNIDSYDNWLAACIGSGVCFGASLVFLILLYRRLLAQRRAGRQFVKNHTLFGKEEHEAREWKERIM